MSPLRRRLRRLKKRKKSDAELRRLWKERLLGESEFLEKDYSERVLRRITELESIIIKKGLDTPTLRRLFNHTKKRFGLLSISKDDLVELIKEILAEKDEIASINEILLELAKKRYEVNRFKLEKILLELSMKGIIFINKGVVSSKRPSDTKLAVKLLNLVKERRKITFSEALMFLRRDDSVVNLIIDDLSAVGLIAVDKSSGEIIYV